MWPGIDVVYRGDRGELECDFDVSPGADISKVRLELDGASNALVSTVGDLLLDVGGRQVRFAVPTVYTKDALGKRREIAARYVIDSPAKGSGKLESIAGQRKIRVSFDVAAYDKAQRLIIDPALTYSTYLGGTGHPSDIAGNYFGDSVNGVAVDPSGDAYIAGITGSPDFPVSSGAFQTSCPDRVGCDSGFVAKLDSTGSKLLYATFLGGSGSGDYAEIADQVNGIAINSKGEAYVTGMTFSSDFPTTPGSSKCNFESAFVSRLSADGGSLIYSTCLGGDQPGIGNGIAVDGSGNAYVTGQISADSFPVTPNGAFPGSGGPQDAFVAALDPSGMKILYAALLGSNSIGNSIAVSKSGYVYVGGEDSSGTLPTTHNAFEPKCKTKQAWAQGNCFNKFAVMSAGFVTVSRTQQRQVKKQKPDIFDLYWRRKCSYWRHHPVWR